MNKGVIFIILILIVCVCLSMSAGAGYFYKDTLFPAPAPATVKKTQEADTTAIIPAANATSPSELSAASTTTTPPSNTSAESTTTTPPSNTIAESTTTTASSPPSESSAVSTTTAPPPPPSNTSASTTTTTTTTTTPPVAASAPPASPVDYCYRYATGPTRTLFYKKDDIKDTTKRTCDSQWGWDFTEPGKGNGGPIKGYDKPVTGAEKYCYRYLSNPRRTIFYKASEIKTGAQDCSKRAFPSS